MSDIPQTKIDDLVPVDIRITNVNDLPAKYFLHDEVSEALRRIVRSDVVVHGAPVPPGAQAVMGSKVKGRKLELKRQSEAPHAIGRLIDQTFYAIHDHINKLPALVIFIWQLLIIVAGIAVIWQSVRSW